MRTLSALFLTAFMALSGAAHAGSPVLSHMDPHQNSVERLPACTDSSVAFRVKYLFNTTEARFWNSDLRIDEVRIEGTLGERSHTHGRIARRWCEGTALFTDGSKRMVRVELVSDMSYLNVSYGIHTCVQGLDRHNAYAPDCRVLRPRDF